MGDLLMIDFVSNDFLGFARCPHLLDQVNQKYMQHCYEFPHTRLGSLGSRLILGDHQFLFDLEQKIANYHQVEDALLVHSGYMANLGLCTHLDKCADIILYDEAVHISISHSLSYVTTKAIPFRNNDLEHCEFLLKQHASGKKVFILVSSVYSFQGTQAPLQKLLMLAEQYQASLIVDEAHAMGVLGNSGRGLCYELGYQHFYAVLVTYGKAMGSMGAAILTSSKTKAELYQEFVLSYSTAMAPYIMVAISVAYDWLNLVGEERRARLASLQNYYSQSYSKVFECPVGPMHISLDDMQIVQQILVSAGLHVGIIVQGESACLRVHLHVYNSESEIDHLMGVLQELYQKNYLKVSHVESKAV